RSKWRHSPAGGTVLTDPVFQSDFELEYRQWSYAKSKAQSSAGLLSLLLPSTAVSSGATKPSFKTKTKAMASSEWSLRSLDKPTGSNANETQRLVDSNARMVCDEATNDDDSDFEDQGAKTDS